MATLHLVPMLINGVRDTAGAVVASGAVYFYLPGTTTQASVYSDVGGTTPISQPLTLNSVGQGAAYTNQLLRVRVRNAADDTTIVDYDPPNAIPAEQVVINNANVNAGAETTLDSWFDTDALQYQESSGAVLRDIPSWLKVAAVQADDFNAVGDGATDDKDELQGALDRVLGNDRTDADEANTAVFEIGAGTYLHGGVMTATVASGTKAVIIRGQGPKATILKNSTTDEGGIHFNYTGGATDVKLMIENLALTCSTVSSGAAIQTTNANKGILRNVEIAGYRTGVDAASENNWTFQDVEVASTDGNAAAIGITCGANCKFDRVKLTGTSSNGTGLLVGGADCKVRGVEVSGFATGLQATGARLRGDVDVTTVANGLGLNLDAANANLDVYVAGVASTDTALDIDGANCRICGYVTGCATGIDIGAVAGTDVSGLHAVSNTADFVFSTSATNTVTDGMVTGAGVVPGAASRARSTFTGTTSLTPVIPGGSTFHVNHFVKTSSGSGTLTINAPATTYRIDGMVIRITIGEEAGQSHTIAFDSAYQALNGSSVGTDTLSSNSIGLIYEFQWSESDAKWIEILSANGVLS